MSWRYDEEGYMDIVFFMAAAVAVASTVMVLVQVNVVRALLYLILSLLAVAVIFFSLGAAFVAALEVIIYAGAIMVLFVFVVMMLNLGAAAAKQERHWLSPGMWAGPAALAVLLLADVIYMLTRAGSGPSVRGMVEPKQVALALYGPYLIGVELSSILLLAGLVGAYHLGRRSRRDERAGEGNHS